MSSSRICLRPCEIHIDSGYLKTNEQKSFKLNLRYLALYTIVLNKEDPYGNCCLASDWLSKLYLISISETIVVSDWFMEI